MISSLVSEAPVIQWKCHENNCPIIPLFSASKWPLLLPRWQRTRSSGSFCCRIQLTRWNSYNKLACIVSWSESDKKTSGCGKQQELQNRINNIDSVDDVKGCTQMIWGNWSEDYIKSLYISIPPRICAVLRSIGFATNYITKYLWC